MEETLYRKATTFKNLVCLNIAFLKGILTRTPYHLAPISEETIPLLSSLVQLQKKGFLSVQGQPGVIENSKNDNTQHKQKSYIVGYMHNSLSEKLQSFIQGKPFYMVIIKNKKTVYNSLPQGKYNLTRIVFDDSKQNQDFTNIWKDKHYPYEEFEGYTVNSLLKKDYVFVEVYSTVYGEGYSTEQVLLDFFESIPKSESVEIDTTFSPKLLKLDDKLLYLIAVKDSKVLDDEDFDFVKRLLFLSNCKELEIEIVDKNSFKELIKKMNKLNIKLKVNYDIFRCIQMSSMKSPSYGHSPIDCKNKDKSDCDRNNSTCRWQNSYLLKGKEIPASCRKRPKKRSPKKKSPKRVKSPKKKSPKKKSPKKRSPKKRSPSRCSKKRKAECVSSSSCNWVKGYKNAVSGKRVSSLCRRKVSGRVSPSRSASRSSPSALSPKFENIFVEEIAMPLFPELSKPPKRVMKKYPFFSDKQIKIRIIEIISDFFDEDLGERFNDKFELFLNDNRKKIDEMVKFLMQKRDYDDDNVDPIFLDELLENIIVDNFDSFFDIDAWFEEQ